MPNPDPTPEEVEAQMETARAYFATRGFTSADHDITRNDIEALALLLATEVKKAAADNFSLAANQCHDGYLRENGSHRCWYQADIARLREALEYYADLGNYEDGVLGRDVTVGWDQGAGREREEFEPDAGATARKALYPEES